LSAGAHYVEAMSVPVLLFASYADVFGTRRLQVPVNTPCRVSDLVNAIREMPGGDRLPPRPLVAVNHTWLHDLGSSIDEGDEIALIPPVAGG
jgi:molybdopterin synthase sulfur carrier subunit